ncbi:hypothetical protein JQ628_13960 [Bradyrhizobium lablabi]|uniref:hypothetical protein n=1 Tax=Bradyrhizobium lablabi TaxID=722472 RepID=UPI001BACF2DB|nr:hypothetical protein [Bradyrhizobium lablabi]MBR1122627.1 hypothetical protein [Bradyrhizobium lablabi]
MRAQVFAWEQHPVLAQWMSRKSVRLAMLLGVLLTVSIAVNAMIILAAGNGP